ncbi:hypothetical protein V8J82_20095 [Gymnodinialimonas sp. 2305UL16-5]|uniref:DUF6985 domain-containing protein n=1 Tax=Gymnodinialimonas mytili TaxID=3126503 RepID=UPI0030A5F558
MTAEWLQHLGDLQFAPPAEREAWLAAHPLRAFLQDQPVGEIRRSDMNAFKPPKAGAQHRMIFRWKSGAMFMNVRLPSDLTYKGLSFVDVGDDPRRYVIRFETDQGTITTNRQELSQTMVVFGPGAKPDEEEWRRRFLSMRNVFNVPIDPPEMEAFVSRHLGKVEPDNWGEADSSLSVPRLSANPLAVQIEGLGAEDAADIDAVLDRFVNDLDGHLTGASGAVIQNMRDFAGAAYRDPDGPPLIGASRDDLFEAALAVTEPDRIWGHVQPYLLRIRRDGYPDDPPAEQRVAEGPIYLTLISHCDWETEHGLGMTWRDGAVLSAVGDHSVRLEDGRAP